MAELMAAVIIPPSPWILPGENGAFHPGLTRQQGGHCLQVLRGFRTCQGNFPADEQLRLACELVQTHKAGRIRLRAAAEAAQAGAQRDIIRSQHALQPLEPGNVKTVARAQRIPDAAVIDRQNLIDGGVKLICDTVKRVSGLYDVDWQPRGLRMRG